MRLETVGDHELVVTAKDHAPELATGRCACACTATVDCGTEREPKPAARSTPLLHTGGRHGAPHKDDNTGLGTGDHPTNAGLDTGGEYTRAAGNHDPTVAAVGAGASNNANTGFRAGGDGAVYVDAPGNHAATVAAVGAAAGVGGAAATELKSVLIPAVHAITLSPPFRSCG